MIDLILIGILAVIAAVVAIFLVAESSADLPLKRPVKGKIAIGVNSV
jgi:hypothetical protein